MYESIKIRRLMDEIDRFELHKVWIAGCIKYLRNAIIKEAALNQPNSLHK